MSIFLVRHGETTGNRDRIIQVAETPLSALGLQQAERLGTRLAARGVARILCSDLTRAQMTAAPLARLTGAQLTLTPLLRERDFGALRGVPYAELKFDPFAPEYAPPEGESWADFYLRAAEAFALISATRGAVSGNLVVITHGLMVRALFDRHVPRTASEIPHLFLNTGVTELAALPPHAATLVNCGAHLRDGAAGGDGAPC